jgi:hypothetical protein
VDAGVLWPGRRCDLCGALLVFAAITTPSGAVFCPSHQDLPNCQLCGAPFRGGGTFCTVCAATTVNTQDQVRLLLPKAREVLRTMGIVLSQPVHVQLVDKARMDAMGVHESGKVAGMTMVRGRCVTEILVVAGLSEMEFGAAVAHEVMHAWMVQNRFPRVDPKVEEGLCQTVAYRWLRDQLDPHAATLRYSIDNSPDPVYGVGFRMVKDAVKRHGMNPVLATVKATGRLP